jgi:AmmeMemoRadiSam system protein B
MIRRAAVAGSWYPGNADQLRSAVESHLERAASEGVPAGADLIGLVAPHAGLVYSGPVAAYAYRLLRERAFDLIVLVGPSHYVGFEGVSVWPSGAFETPCGSLDVDAGAAAALIERCPIVKELPAAHAREHSLEMQLPFLAHIAPETKILPLVMGQQTRTTAFALADALVDVVRGRLAPSGVEGRVLLVASSDLSHFHDAKTAARLDSMIVDDVDRLDADGLMTRLEGRPDHACGGGPIVTVLRASRALGATGSRVLRYADSGDVSGDKSSVVGYLAAALWR